eukprot:1894546-Pyramimonas_sp.AAC.1
MIASSRCRLSLGQHGCGCVVHHVSSKCDASGRSMLMPEAPGSARWTGREAGATRRGRMSASPRSIAYRTWGRYAVLQAGSEQEDVM